MEQVIDYKELAMELVRTKGVVSSTPTASYGHGPGGLFSYPGLERPVFSAMTMPIMGLQDTLPVRSSRDANPLYSIFTGVTASSGSEPVGVCDDPPTVGLAKLCTHTAPFGRQARQTKVFELDRMGLWTNRAEFGDQQFMGNPWNPLNKNPNVPTTPGGNSMDAVLRGEVAKALFEFAIGWSRDFAREIYTGNPANNTAGGGRKYAYGLDILINTGRRDAITGQLCSAADSIVQSFGGADVSTSAAAGVLIVRWITNIMRRLKMIGDTTGLSPVKWAIAMRETLFYELTAVWPCSYQTYRCNVSNSNSALNNVNTNRSELNAMTDEMRQQHYLLIDGQRFEVILDNTITETNMAGSSFRSDIYFVPMTVLGGTPVTLMEYIDYDSPMGAMEAARTFAPDGFYSTSDNGRFLWHKKLPNNFCVQMLAKTEPRLLLLTPHLAARLTTVQYTPLAHERDWDPSATSYYVDGGRTDYNGYPASFYSPVSGY